MLCRLHIRNYLLITELDLPLDDGLTIITGETGSGKSILIGALGLAMGERADTTVARDPAKRCIIELEVDLSSQGLQDWFSAQELPYEARTIVRRQIDPGGRSRAFINDTPVRLEQLRELGARMVHVHSQHHTLLLNDPWFQLGLVDHWAGNAPRLRTYRKAYDGWRETASELERMREEEARSRAEVDFLRFQLEELDKAMLREGEQAAMESALSRAEHGEDLVRALQHVEQALAAEDGMLTALARLRQMLSRSAKADAAVLAISDRMNAVSIELKDIAEEAERLGSEVSLDPREAMRLRERLDMLYGLARKHRVADADALIEVRDAMQERLQAIGSLEEGIAALERKEAALRSSMDTEAAALSAARQAAIAPLSTEVERLLKDLGMPHAVFRFAHKQVPPGIQGTDTVRAMFSANRDRDPAALDRVASGGELGRVMLALISLAADSQGLSTVVFDEIDTGVSGEVADRVGSLMARMAQRRQILAITHLPQIASKATHHLQVVKSGKAGAVETRISALEMDRRVEAIAQMLSGRKLTKAALENARALLGQG